MKNSHFSYSMTADGEIEAYDKNRFFFWTFFLQNRSLCVACEKFSSLTKDPIVTEEWDSVSGRYCQCQSSCSPEVSSVIATKVGRSLIQGQSYDMDRTLQLNSFYKLSFMGWVSHPVSSVSYQSGSWNKLKLRRYFQFGPYIDWGSENK